MSKKDYAAFSVEVARESFKIEVDDLPNGNFKDFCLEQFDSITSEHEKG